MVTVLGYSEELCAHGSAGPCKTRKGVELGSSTGMVGGLVGEDGGDSTVVPKRDTAGTDSSRLNESTSAAS